MTDAGYFNIQDFKSNITDYHRASNFHMLLSSPPGLQTGSRDSQQQTGDTVSRLHYLIESTSVPGIELATDEIRRYGYGSFQRKPYVPVFEPLTAIVRSDADGSAYSFFQSWMALIINSDVRNGVGASTGIRGSAPYEVAYKADYVVDADIVAYDDSGLESIHVTMREFFPFYLGDISVSWDDGNTLVKFPVKFTYTDWFIPNIDV